jgi:putative hemin transport protein
MTRPATAADRVAAIRAAVRDKPGKMTLQHAAELGVPEVEIIRALPDGWAVELDASRWEELIRSFESLGELHVIVSNGAATLEAVGQFGGFSTWGEFFNIQTDTLDMHIRYRELGAVFAVEKPSHMNGVATLSFQFYDKTGAAALKIFLNFGGRATGEKVAAFVRLREQLRKRDSGLHPGCQ